MPRTLPRALAAFALCVTLGFQGCGPSEEALEAPPDELFATLEQGLTDCSTRTDTGYVRGSAFPITVVTVDSKPVELDTANAFTAMQAAAAAQGVNIVVVSGFRTMSEQRYLYGCYVNCNCNNCNLAAQPGYSNHQSGHALDLNTSNAAVSNWLNAHAAAFGFKRTVPSEAWHWEWWGGGPGGGACSQSADGCTLLEQQNCGAFGCGCVDHQCNGGACPGPGCSASHTQACGGFGCGCADGACGGAFCPGSGCSAKETYDCGQYGCGCVDHQCSGGFCPGSGSTARNVLDCGGYGCHSVDGKCSGGYCPGSGCTAKQTLDCQAVGCGCVDEQCSGGACAGTGCTARQTLDCEARSQGCALGQCVPAPTAAGPEPTTAAPADAGTTPGAPAPPDAGESASPQPVAPPPSPAPAAPGTPTSAEPAPAEAVVGSCAAAPGLEALAPLLLLLARPGRRRVGGQRRAPRGSRPAR